MCYINKFNTKFLVHKYYNNKLLVTNTITGQKAWLSIDCF